METIDTAIFSRLLYLIAPPAFRCEIAPALLSAEKGVAVLRFLIVLTVISTEPILFPQSAVAATWNYCEPLGRYYPYTPTCPVPWKEVQPNNAPNGGMPLPRRRSSTPMIPPSAQPQPSRAQARSCYDDTTPDGCREFVRAAEQGLKSWDTIPKFCAVSPDPKSGMATMGPTQELTREQLKICITALNLEAERERQQQQRQQQERVKTQHWVDIEADNGDVYQVDVAHIQHEPGNSIVEVEIKGDAIPLGSSFFLFDCAGHFEEVGGPLVWLHAAPKSVMGVISNTVCAPAEKEEGRAHQ
jgi:hypothetical protein